MFHKTNKRLRESLTLIPVKDEFTFMQSAHFLLFPLFAQVPRFDRFLLLFRLWSVV